jgi:hypothetical protein
MFILTLFSLKLNNLTLNFFLTYRYPIQDPDPHSFEKLDLDPHKVNADPKHCLSTCAQC